MNNTLDGDLDWIRIEGGEVRITSQSVSPASCADLTDITVNFVYYSSSSSSSSIFFFIFFVIFCGFLPACFLIRSYDFLISRSREASAAISYFKKLKAASDMLLLDDFWVVGSIFGQWRSKLRKQVHPSGVVVPWFITCWAEGFDNSRFYRRTTLPVL